MNLRDPLSRVFRKSALEQLSQFAKPYLPERAKPDQLSEVINR